ncbi:nickel/cobalt transporter [Pasteurella atlantica]|uniref:nickel/cobalt transporter n=1 Tax=Pasteurellaceae TaxID=712 RepID=UPI00275A7806|nr:nickel/cobalt transporter [Pasteurella atlantica]MDP8100060.1 nickel/cobalt transporter [Pasteurella atlantica]MDP8107986.1 nickel/cobalt transporter [Pasteurella atlantica]MDP8117676.1 nickel/cobalt transporter [Pasteurella atlantica]
MQKIMFKLGLLAIGFLIIFAIYEIYPYLLFKILKWQKVFNQEISHTLLQIKNNPQAGWILIYMSFLYGVFHSLGPGHGKFILSSYLSFEKTKLTQAIRLTLLSSFAQGIVAIMLVSIVVVIFTLSRHYFNDTVKLFERGSFIVMILFGLYWLKTTLVTLKKQYDTDKKPVTFNLQKITKIVPLKTQKLSIIASQPHQHTENCGCGHQHLPNANQLAKAKDWKAQLMIILSIASRPCSGAILVLFFSYTLDLYYWGIISALAMAFGTGLTLTLFALIVLFARHKAIYLSKWYISIQTSKKVIIGLKIIAAISIIILGITLLHSSFLDTFINNKIFR